MKFSFARGAIALAATLTLASCGGGKATFPINVNVLGVVYPGLVLSTNGQDLVINPPAKAGDPVNAVFPNQIEYGEIYDVVPKGQATANGVLVLGQNPQHQTCQPNSEYPNNLPTYGTAGQLAKIQINYVCSINAYPLTGVVKGLKTDGLVLTNGSNGAIPVAKAVDATSSAATGADVAFSMNPVVYNNTYGVTVLTQPTGQTCTVTNGVGIMDDAAEKLGGVSNLVVNCQ